MDIIDDVIDDRYDLGKFHHDLTWRPTPIDDGECKGNHPQVAELFKL